MLDNLITMLLSYYLHVFMNKGITLLLDFKHAIRTIRLIGYTSKQHNTGKGEYEGLCKQTVVIKKHFHYFSTV